MSSLFITFEGGDGVGKSTQISLLAEHFEELGYPYIITKEPGGTSGGAIIRELILSGAAQDYGPISELLLFAADRIDHVDQIIKPALLSKTIVLCDRFIDSTTVYQSNQLLSEDLIAMINQVSTHGLVPDLTFLLDVPVEIAAKRRHKRGRGKADRFEKDTVTLHKNRRKKFLELAKNHPDRIHVIDASKDVQHISKNIIKICSKWIETTKWKPPQL